MNNKPRSCFTSDGKPKLRFDTRAEAKAHDRMMRARYPNNKPLEVYRCPFCDYFHLGTYPTDPEAREGKKKRHHPEMEEPAADPSSSPDSEGSATPETSSPTERGASEIARYSASGSPD